MICTPYREKCEEFQMSEDFAFAVFLLNSTMSIISTVLWMLIFRFTLVMNETLYNKVHLVNNTSTAFINLSCQFQHLLIFY